ncbi:hypothetical protein JCM5296_006472 [Sporobolomyces johnsonii]
MSAATHQKQAQAAKLFFDTFALGDFDKAAEIMSDRMTFVWEMRPASVHAGLASNGKLKKKDVLEFWRKIKTELMKDVSGTLADGDPFESDQWYHIEFVPGTIKFLKCVELVDSAMVLQHKKRLAEKTAASHHTAAVRN